MVASVEDTVQMEGHYYILSLVVLRKELVVLVAACVVKVVGRPCFEEDLVWWEVVQGSLDPSCRQEDLVYWNEGLLGPSCEQEDHLEQVQDLGELAVLTYWVVEAPPHDSSYYHQEELSVVHSLLLQVLEDLEEAELLHLCTVEKGHREAYDRGPFHLAPGVLTGNCW
jgi:hypothetical protein